MNCIYCSKPSSDFQFCFSCAFDDTITITHPDAIKRFKMDDMDIENANIPSVCIQQSGIKTTRYLIADIIELAKVLYKDLDNKDPKKRAYLEEKLQFYENFENSDNFYALQSNARNIIYDLLTKNDCCVENECELLQEHMIKLIDRFIIEHIRLNTNIYAIIMGNIDSLVDSFHKKKEVIKREKELTEIFPKDYREFVTEHPYYYQYAEGKCSFEVAFNIICEHIDNVMNGAIRLAQIEDFIEGYTEEQKEVIRNLIIYDRYFKEKCSFDEVKEKINEVVETSQKEAIKKPAF